VGFVEDPILDVGSDSTCLVGQLACLTDSTRDPRSHGPPDCTAEEWVHLLLLDPVCPELTSPRGRRKR
jgi:hypothetical protein